MSAIRMGLREANQQFSRVAKAVRAGQEIVLTDRGEPIAVIKPLMRRGGFESALRRLTAAGLIRSPSRWKRMQPWKPRPITGPPITETLQEERKAR